MEDFDYKAMEALALEQLKSGKPLLGKGGAFAPLLEKIINAALEGEMDAHMDSEERSLGNRRNGYMSKQVQTGMGEVTVHTPRDRDSRFEPEFIKKRERILADGVSDRIISLYALGNSTREISDWMEENLGNRVSADTISSITDRILPELQSWRSRPLDSVYPIVWMDAVHYKVMDERTALQHEPFTISESKRYSACTDNLSGFSDAILSVFSETTVQSCIVRRISNSVKYMASKNHKEFVKDLKQVYQALHH